MNGTSRRKREKGKMKRNILLFIYPNQNPQDRASDESRGAPVTLHLIVSLKTAFRDEAVSIASPKYRSRRDATHGLFLTPTTGSWAILIINDLAEDLLVFV